MPVNVRGRNFLKLLDYTPEEIRYLLDVAKEFKRMKRNGTPHKYLEGKNIRVLVLGDGNKVTSQYPSTNSTIYEDDLVILKTNGNTKKMIDLTGYSYKEANNILRLMGVSYMLEGNGYVYEQSIPEGETITDTVTIKLKNKYIE